MEHGLDKPTRVLRFEREVHHVLSEFLVSDIEHELPAFTSLSAVEVSSDLRRARVFFRLVGTPAQAESTKKILERDRALFQRRIARDIQAKFTPVLRFEYGVSPHRDDVDVLLENLHRPRHFGE